MSWLSCAIRRKARRSRSSAAPWSAGDLNDERAIRAGMEGCDAVIHAAAVYEVGIPASERKSMREANVGGTERVLGAALEAADPEGRLRLHRRRLRQHQRADRRRGLRAPGRRLHLRVREDEVGSPPGRQTADRRRTALRDRPAGRRLRARRHLFDRRPPGPVPERQDAADPLPRAGDLPDPRRGHRRRDHPGARQRQARRGLHPQRAGDDRARGDRRRRRGDRQEGAEARAADRADEGADPDRPAGRQIDGTAAEPARADLLRRRRHLLGEPREGDARARLRTARPRGGAPRPPRRRRQAARRPLRK